MTTYAGAPLPLGWVWTAVSDLCAPGRKCAYGVLQPGDHTPGGMPLIRVSDMGDGRVRTDELKLVHPSIAAQYPRTRLRGGEVLISLVGTIGRTALVPTSLAGANTARAVGVIPVTSLLEQRWVELWFRNPAKVQEMTAKAHEVARKTLNLEDVVCAAAAIPPLPEQRRIVAEVEKHFTRLDAAVASLKRAQAGLKRYRAAVLKAACEGRLVPTEAELARAEGRPIPPWPLSAALLSAGGARSAAASTSAPLPEGWAWTTLKQIASLLAVRSNYGGSA